MIAANKSRRILVTDSDTNAGLACIRDLGRRGFEVFASGSVSSPPSSWSRYTQRYKKTPCAWRNPESAITENLQYAREVGADAILPVSEASLAALQLWQTLIPAEQIILRGNKPALDYGLSKIKTFQRAIELNLPVAQGLIVVAGQEQPKISLHDFPLIIRTDNRWSNDYSQYLKGQSWIIGNQHELTSTHRELQSLGVDYLLQKYFPGRGYGVFIRMFRGRIEHWYTHERLAEIPWFGGVSARRKITFDKSLLHIAKLFFEHLNFSGIAMLELRGRDDIVSDHLQTNGTFLVELNTRPWGSLPLSLHAKIPIISSWATQQLFEPKKLNIKIPLRRKSETFICSNLYPGEVQHVSSILKSLKAKEISPHDALVKIGLSVKTILNPNTRFDFFISDDVFPCLRQWGVFTKAIFLGLTSASNRALTAFFYFAFKSSRFFQINSPLHRKGRPQGRITLLCLGNRCRSPFAEQLLRQYLPEGLHVVSRGLSVKEETIPERFHGLFLKYNLDPTNHRAKSLTKGDIDSSDQLIFMERIHIRVVLRLFGNAHAHKCKLLSDSLPSGKSPDINDPFLLSPGAAAMEFERIANACLNFAQTSIGDEMNCHCSSKS